LGHITLKIVAHDEQKQDSRQITLKIVTGPATGERRTVMKATMKVREGVARAKGIWFFGPRPEK